MGVFREARHTIDILSFEEVQHVIGAETDLVVQADVPAGGSTAVNLIVEAEVRDLLILGVLLHRLQILLRQDR